jgi:ankyrin repeat protein
MGRKAVWYKTILTCEIILYFLILGIFVKKLIFVLAMCIVFTQNSTEAAEPKSESNQSLFFALYENKSDKATKLVNAIPKGDKRSAFVTKKNGLGSTPLHWAALNNNFKLVQFLVNQIPVDRRQQTDFIIQQNENGDTALHFASHKGNLKIAKFLVKKVPTKNERRISFIMKLNKDHESALGDALLSFNCEMYDFLCCQSVAIF